MLSEKRQFAEDILSSDSEVNLAELPDDELLQQGPAEMRESPGKEGAPEPDDTRRHRRRRRTHALTAQYHPAP